MENFRYVNCDRFEKEGQILKMTLPQRNGDRIKTPSSKLTILVSSCWEKNDRNNDAHKFFILLLVFLKLLIVSVAFFLGHPVFSNVKVAKIDGSAWGGGGGGTRYNTTNYF